MREVRGCPPGSSIAGIAPHIEGRSLKTKQPCSAGFLQTVGTFKLLRKEVIQPHLPIRLPCYDFTPITSPTLGDYLSCELAHRLRVLPTFVV